MDNMKYRCDNCDEYHDIGDLTINISEEGHKLIDDIGNVVVGISKKERSLMSY